MTNDKVDEGIAWLPMKVKREGCYDRGVYFAVCFSLEFMFF